MQCQGLTRSGDQCRNRATLNGFCHLHGGLPSKKERQKDFQRIYANMSPEEREAHDKDGRWIIYVIYFIVFIISILKAIYTIR
jgi:hypothetical protein